jgi:hypothetical protein
MTLPSPSVIICPAYLHDGTRQLSRWDEILESRLIGNFSPARQTETLPRMTTDYADEREFRDKPIYR